MVTLQARMPEFGPGTQSRRKEPDTPTPSCVLMSSNRICWWHVHTMAHAHTYIYIHHLHTFKKKYNFWEL